MRVACLAARVGRDAAAPALGGSLNSSQGIRAPERPLDRGLLTLVPLCGRRRVLRWLLWLLWLFFSTFTPAITSVACFSFLTLGEQGDSSFTVNFGGD